MKLSLEQVRRTYRYHHVDGQEHPIPDLDEFLAFAANEVHRLELLFFDLKTPSWGDAHQARRLRAYGELLGSTMRRYSVLPGRLIVAHASAPALRELKSGILSAGEARCELAFDASGGLGAMLGVAANPLRVAHDRATALSPSGRGSARVTWGRSSRPCGPGTTIPRDYSLEIPETHAICR